VTQSIVPFARPLFLCEDFVRRERGKMDFLGAYHAVSPRKYPFTQDWMCVVAHLSGGLGTVNTYIDIREAETDSLIHTSIPREIVLPSRDYLIRLTHRFQSVRFPKPGIYLVELYCEHECIADISVFLRPPLTGSSDE